MLNRPGSSALCWMISFFTASYHQLVWSPNSIGIPKNPFARVWLSLPYLVSDVSDPQLSDFLSWPSYKIVQRPLNRPLNLWIGMFDRHQAEITVMQFTGHSLPVHQSMSVSWTFTLSHFISQIRPRDLFRLLAGASLWNGMFARAEGQYTTIAVPKLYNWATSSYRIQLTPNLERVLMQLARHILIIWPCMSCR